MNLEIGVAGGVMKYDRKRVRCALGGVTLAATAVVVSVGGNSGVVLAQEAGASPAQGAASETPASATVAEIHVNGNGARSTGQKNLDNILLRTPRAGAAVTSEVAEQQQVDTVTDISRRVPNYRPNIAQPRQSRMAIRGVGIAAQSAGTGSPSDTGYIVDDVYWSFAGFQWGDFVDFSSIELLLGPTGTAGAKNTNVGSIIVHTQLPSFVPSTTLRSTFGNYNHFKQTINTTGTLVPDKWAYRFSGYLDRGDGWIKDATTGSTYLDINRFGLHAQLLGVGDDWSDRISFTYNASNEHNDYLTGTVGDTSIIYANGTLAKTTFFQNMWTKLHKLPYTIDPNTPDISRNGRDPTHVFTLSNQFAYQLGDNTLKSISAIGYGSFRNNGFSDNQLLQLGFSSGGMDTYALQTSQEFRLSSPTDQKLEWTTGLFTYFEALEDRMHHYEFGVDSAAWLGNPAALLGLTSWWLNKARDFQAAIYGQATYHFDEQASLTFGLRDSYDIRYGSNKFRPSYIYGVPYSVFQQDAALVAAGGYGWSDTGGAVNYHNGVIGTFNPKYQVNENILVYGLIGRGDKQPAVNTQNTPVYISGIPQGFKAPFNKAETSWDYEIGAKTNWFDGKLISNVNFYWNDLYNFQIGQSKTFTSPSGVSATTAALGNAPHVRLRGVELVEQWKPTEELTFNLSGAYTEARYIDYQDAPTPTDWTFAGGPTTMSLSNTRITGLPWWQINGGVNYERHLGNVLADLGAWADRPVSGFAYGNAAYFTKSQYTHPRSVQQYWQPDYVMFDAGVGLKTDDKKFSVTLWAKNLFDNRPWSSWAPGTSSAPTTVGISTQGPRTFGITSSVTF